MSKNVSRRQFVAGTAAAGIALSVARTGTGAPADKPALLGGKRTRKGASGGPKSWPIVEELEEKNVAEVVRSGHWYRSENVEKFEQEYAKLTGAKNCIAVSSGTSALFSSLGALGVGPGDEVILAPYTFVATVNVALLHYAMPVFVDTDRETFMMDPRKLEAAITERTAAIIPIHIGGSVADMDSILAIAKKHNVPVVEDACQAHLAEWRNRSVGTWGTTGCFSFQLSKNLCSGEGGVILAGDEEIANKCYAFHNNCRQRKVTGYNFTYVGGRATNLRMTEFQGAILRAQLTRIEKNAKKRTENAEYLTSMLREIPGILPARMYDGCTRNAYHLYMFRYQPEHFAGLSRAKFLQALSAEGVGGSGGYGPLNKAEFIQNALHTKPYVRVYGQKAVDTWMDRNQCPENDKLCEEAVWFGQTTFLGARSDMDQIAEAVRKIHAHAGALAKR